MKTPPLFTPRRVYAHSATLSFKGRDYLEQGLLWRFPAEGFFGFLVHWARQSVQFCLKSRAQVGAPGIGLAHQTHVVLGRAALPPCRRITEPDFDPQPARPGIRSRTSQKAARESAKGAPLCRGPGLRWMTVRQCSQSQIVHAGEACHACFQWLCFRTTCPFPARTMRLRWTKGWPTNEETA